MAQPSALQAPLKLGTPEEFARIRSALKAARFDEETIYATLRIEEMSDVGSINLAELDFSQVPEQFELFVRLFFVLKLVPLADVQRLLDPETINSFLSLGVLGTGEFGVDAIYARVLLYPVAGFLMCSDRHTNPDGSPFAATPDLVFPAIYAGTLRFLRLLPLSRATDSLDLCAGTGIGAFVLSRCSEHAVSSDVTERAKHFALFNRALNNLRNVDVICGDLYGGVQGQTFDRIVAHPPYVPSLSTAAIWRDGGLTGELLLKRIVEGLPQYLRPGGIACVMSLGLDTKEGQLQERARGWLQEDGNDFDIIFAFTKERTPNQVLRDLAERDGGLGPDQLRKLKDAFDEAGVVSMPHGALVIRRHSTDDRHSAWSMRTHLSDETSGEDCERAFTLHTQILEAGFLQSLARRRPVLAPRLQVKATHVVYEGSLVPAEFIFETDKPFNALGRVDRWMVPLFVRFDGVVTPEEIYDKARAEAELPDGFMLDDFMDLVARMIERGFLVLPDEDKSPVR